jgi:diguanylate cyclase (GGDEF)-like protein
MHKALSSDKELSILMLDIDNFKMINDNLGHDAGDSVICNVAALAAETMRSRDFFARIGGEEFAATLPDATIEQARAIAEHIREKIQDSIQDHSNKNSKLNSSVTVSIGIASIRDVKENFDSLLHAADLAMYQAKINGRNQVFSFTNEKK